MSLPGNNFYKVKTVKLRFSEKPQNFEEISLLVLAVLNNVKTKGDISSNFVAF